MPDFQYLQPGDEQIHAATFNACVDTARAFMGNSPGATEALGKAVGSNPGVIKVRNTTAVTIERFGVGMLAAPTIKPPAATGGANNADGTDSMTADFKSRICFNLVTPAAGGEGNYAVVLEPIAPQGFGWAVVSGFTVAIVDVKSKTHKYVEIDPAKMVLKSANSGAARIMWLEGYSSPATTSCTNSGKQLAVIKIGGGGSAQSITWVLITGPLSGNCNYAGYIAIPKQGDYDGSTNFDGNFFEFASPPEACIVVNPPDQITNNHSLYGYVPCYHSRTNSDGKKVMLTYAFSFTACNPSTGEPDDEGYMGGE